MNKRIFGKTGVAVSEIGLGTWQLGGKWGDAYDEEKAMTILNTAYNNGVNLFDTADGYNGGKSELSIGEFIKDNKDVFVITKAGRGLNPHTAEMYTIEAIEKFIDNSAKRMGVKQLDMVLLHCPPSAVYDNKALFDGLDELKASGKIAHYGVSVETVEEAIKAVTNYDVSGVEIIFNMFRLKPLEEFFTLAKEKNVGVIVRVPLASGLLTGTLSKNSVFGANDHRTFNRNGEAFDKGETFSGVPYDTGLLAVDELKELFGTEKLAPIALKWVLMHDAVSTVIPGASAPEQVISNIEATNLPDLTSEQMRKVEEIYNKYIKEHVHQSW